MASIKVKLRPSAGADRRGTIFYQILHERKQRLLFTTYRLYPTEWDAIRSVVKIRGNGARHRILMVIRESMRHDLERLAGIVYRFENMAVSFSADDVVEEYRRFSEEYRLFRFMQGIISMLRRNGKIRTSETYTAALNSFRNFRNGEDIMLDCLSAEIMERYEFWLKGRGNCLNTVSFYMRILRAAYRRAVEEGVIADRHPFRRVYTGIDKTVKRALPLTAISRIKALDLSGFPGQDFARDMFMMSFMLRGMSLIDMSYLRKRDLADGYVTYRRRKTGQRLVIKWTEEMQRILDKYGENRSEYLLPIIRKTGVNEWYVYRNVGYNINHNLKRIGERIGITIPLTLYVARHSWASAAQAKGIPLSVIAEGMGHENESTTRIYLASLDTTLVDKANSMILKSL
ncbi:MAG: site-specific integrase [Muribaculaceae bacterium]|nr:site-specific integrase [Muribaculaceae bacterium]